MEGQERVRGSGEVEVIKDHGYVEERGGTHLENTACKTEKEGVHCSLPEVAGKDQGTIFNTIYSRASKTWKNDVWKEQEKT